MMLSAAEVSELREILADALSADPELIESLEIVTGTLEAIIEAEQLDESAWYDAQAMETGADRTPPRE